jgi:hypothetical protein
MSRGKTENPLPDFRASLSKYYRAKDHYPLIASIENDTPEHVVRDRFDENLYATGKQRYLIVRDGVVIRDKLVDFVHDENGFTDRVKMVMYFLFMFRDSRYRDFICSVVGKRQGRWDTEVFRNKSSDYFERAGGRKAFTNLRQFLFQTGILDERTLRVTMPELATWFPAAVEIAAQSVSEPAARRSFLASPHGFLIRHKINALLNATPQELAALEFEITYEESEDLLPTIELRPGISEPDTDEFRLWKRQPPSKRASGSLLVEIDPAALERANSQHFLLEQLICELCKERGLLPKTNKHIDLVVDYKDTSLLFEMKSSSFDAIRSQLRRAVSQLLEYRYLYSRKLKKNVLLCAVLERRPRGGIAWLTGYLDDLGIGLIWKNDQNNRLNCTSTTNKLLRDVLPQTSTKDF